MFEKIRIEINRNKLAILLLFLVIVVSIVLLLAAIPREAKIICELGLIAIYIIYIRKTITKVKSNERRYNKFFNLSFLIGLILLVIADIFLYFNQPVIALSAFIIAPYSLLTFIMISNFFDIRSKNNSIWSLIFSYVIFATTLILFFTIFYALITDLGVGGLNYVTADKSIDARYDFIYFSSQIFYSNAMGDIIPFGIARTLMIVETAVSYIIHVIVIGEAINRLRKKKSMNK